MSEQPFWQHVTHFDFGCARVSVDITKPTSSDDWRNIANVIEALTNLKPGAPSPDLDRLRGENDRLREALRTVDARLDNLGLEEDTSARRTIAAALEPQ